MATRYLISTGSPITWTALADDIWHSLADQAAGDAGGFADGVDDITITTGSANLIVDLDVNPVALLCDTAGYGRQITVNVGRTMDVDGNCTLEWIDMLGGGDIECSGNWQMGASTTVADTLVVTLNGTGNVTDYVQNTGGLCAVNTAGTHTATTGFACTTFTLTGGTYDDGGFAHNIAGAISLTAGTLTSTGIWTLNSGGASNVTTNLGHKITLVVASGSTANIGGVSYFNKFTVENGGDVTGATIRFGASEAGWWGPQGGTVNTGMYVYEVITGPGNDITLANQQMQVRTVLAATKTLTMDANIDLGTGVLYLRGSLDDPASIMKLDMGGYSLDCGIVRIGTAEAAAGSGWIDFGSGIVSIASLAMGDNANQSNQASFDAATVNLTGIISGNNQGTYPITMNSAGANVHGGTITDATCTGALHCWGVADGGNNSVDVMHEGSNAGAALGGMMQMVA